jgi:hypothetical protein
MASNEAMSGYMPLIGIQFAPRLPVCTDGQSAELWAQAAMMQMLEKCICEALDIVCHFYRPLALFAFEFVNVYQAIVAEMHRLQVFEVGEVLLCDACPVGWRHTQTVGTIQTDKERSEPCIMIPIRVVKVLL